MKMLLSFILITLLILSTISITAFAEEFELSHHATDVCFRAGGGGSSGGSSGGGGSSGSSGSTGTRHHYHNSDSSSQSSPVTTLLYLILLPLVFCSSTILFYFKLSKRSRKSKKLMKQMMQSDKAWKFKNISTTVEEGFYAIQNAWANLDMTPAAKYMSDDLFENFQTKLNWMAFKNQKNILERIKLVKALPVAVHDDPDNSRDHVWFYIKGKMIDYILDTDTQMVVSGNTNSTSFVEYWQFTRNEDNWVLNKILQKDGADQIRFSE